MNKKTIILVVLAVILIGVIVWVGQKGKPGQPQVQPAAQTSKQPVPQNKIEPADTTTVVSVFPAGFPLEAGAQVSHTYKFIPASSSEQQSTIDYISAKTVAENQKIFSAYITTTGYKIVNKVEKPDLVFYYATKGSSDLYITIKKQNNQVQVSASFLQK